MVHHTELSCTVAFTHAPLQRLCGRHRGELVVGKLSLLLLLHRSTSKSKWVLLLTQFTAFKLTHFVKPPLCERTFTLSTSINNRSACFAHCFIKRVMANSKVTTSALNFVSRVATRVILAICSHQRKHRTQQQQDAAALAAAVRACVLFMYCCVHICVSMPVYAWKCCCCTDTC